MIAHPFAYSTINVNTKIFIDIFDQVESYEYHEPRDEQIEQKDRIYRNYILLLLDYHIHKSNST